MQSTDDTIAKLTANVVRDPDTGCLRWTGSHNHKGYGSIAIDGRSRAVHRVAHEVWIGPIADGLEVDHVHARGCRYRDCVEPEHLEAVTHAENIARSRNANRERTHCPQGHEYDDMNTSYWIMRNGNVGRHCRACKNERQSMRRPCPDCGALRTARHMAAHRRTHVEVGV